MNMSHYCKLVAVKLPICLDFLMVDEEVDVQVGDTVKYRSEEGELLTGTVADVLWTERDSDVVRWMSMTMDLSAGRPVKILRTVWENANVNRAAASE